MADAHKITRDHNCEKCGKTYKRRNDLRKHMQFAHGGKTTEPCPFCGKTFAGESAILKNHIRWVHKG